MEFERDVFSIWHVILFHGVSAEIWYFLSCSLGVKEIFSIPCLCLNSASLWVRQLLGNWLCRSVYIQDHRELATEKSSVIWVELFIVEIVPRETFLAIPTFHGDISNSDILHPPSCSHEGCGSLPLPFFPAPFPGNNYTYFQKWHRKLKPVGKHEQRKICK